MSINYTEEFIEPGLRLVRLAGALDTAGAMSIEDSFLKLVLEGDCSVIVDLSSVDMMSSYGMRMLLVAAKRVHDAGCELHLAAPRPNVMSVMNIAGYTELFPIHDTLDDALLFLSGHISQ